MRYRPDGAAGPGALQGLGRLATFDGRSRHRPGELSVRQVALEGTAVFYSALIWNLQAIRSAQAGTTYCHMSIVVKCICVQ